MSFSGATTPSSRPATALELAITRVGGAEHVLGAALHGAAHAEVLVDVGAVHGDDPRHAQVGGEALRERAVRQRLMRVDEVPLAGGHRRQRADAAVGEVAEAVEEQALRRLQYARVLGGDAVADRLSGLLAAAALALVAPEDPRRVRRRRDDVRLHAEVLERQQLLVHEEVALDARRGVEVRDDEDLHGRASAARPRRLARRERLRRPPPALRRPLPRREPRARDHGEPEPVQDPHRREAHRAARPDRTDGPAEQRQPRAAGQVAREPVGVVPRDRPQRDDQQQEEDEVQGEADEAAVGVGLEPPVVQVADAEGVGARADDALGLPGPGAQEQGAAGDLQAAVGEAACGSRPEPLLASAWLSSASRRNCRSMSFELLLKSSQPATTTRADDRPAP